MSLALCCCFYGAPSRKSLWRLQRHNLSHARTHARTHTHTRTHARTHTRTLPGPHTLTPKQTNTLKIHIYTGDGLVEKGRKKRQIRMQKGKRWVFSLKEESEKKCPIETEREEESSLWQTRWFERISPQESSCPSQVHRRSEYLRLSEESENTEKRRDEAARERERERDSRRKTFYWINSTCSFQGGNWTHTKRRFILHKTITNCSVKNLLSTVVHFRSKLTSHIRFKSTVHLSFTSITCISIEHKLNFIHSLDTARFRMSKTLYRKRESWITERERERERTPMKGK